MNATDGAEALGFSAQDWLDQKLDQWLEFRDQGRDVGIAELCADDETVSAHLELREALAEAIEFQKRLEVVFAETEAAGPPATVTLPRRFRDNEFLGKCFGDYEILEKIAHGGMGVVYKARQVKLRRIVALKMILSGQSASGDQIRRFYLEAEAAAHLEHPGIVPIYEVGEHDGQHFFSMAFVEGESLRTKLAAGPLHPRDAAELIQKTADAVAYAHARGVIHRDLKPGNILIGAQGQPRVTDFGLAKRAESDAELTASGMAIGTPSYMPPEQAAGGSDEIGAGADVYSLGATLYCTLTGRPPFQAASNLETLRQVQQQEPVSPRRLNTAVDRDLETICLKCLEKAADRRYGSAMELSDDLQRYLDGRPIIARPISRAARLMRWYRRNRAVGRLAAMVTLLLLGSLGGSIVAIVLVNAARQTALTNGQKEREGRQKIERQRDRLQRNLKFVQSQVKRYFDHLKNIRREDQRLGDIMGLLKLCDEMQEVVAAYHEEFLREEQLEDPDAYADLAEALTQLATITREVHSGNEAAKIFQQAFDVLQKLLAYHPENTDYRLALASVCNDQGIALEESGEDGAAREQYNKALGILENPSTDVHNSGEWQCLAAMVYMNLGTSYKNSGQRDEGRAALLESLRLWKELDRRSDRKYQPDFVELAAVQSNLADLHREEGKNDEAVVLLEAAIQRLEQEQEQDESVGKLEYFRKALASCYLGVLVAYNNVDGEASREIPAVAEKAIKVWEGLVKDSPRVVDYQTGLCKAYGLYAWAKVGAGDFASGREFCAKALSIQQELSVDQKEFTELVMTTANTRALVALFDVQEGKHESALTLAESGSADIDKVLAKQPGFPRANTIRQTLGAIRAFSLTELGRYEEALPSWNEVPLMRKESQQSRACQKAICRAGLGKDYLAAIAQMRLALGRKKVLTVDLLEPAVMSLASAAALKDPNPNLTDKIRQQRSDGYAAEALAMLNAARQFGYFKDDKRGSTLRAKLKNSPHFAPLRQRSAFQELLGDVEDDASGKAAEKPEP